MTTTHTDGGVAEYLRLNPEDTYADIEIPVTGDAVGVVTTSGSLVLGRAVTPPKNPAYLFAIDDARIGQGVDDLAPIPEEIDAPLVGDKGGYMDVVMFDHDTPPEEHPSCHRLGKVKAIESGEVVDPRSLRGGTTGGER